MIAQPKKPVSKNKKTLSVSDDVRAIIKHLSSGVALKEIHQISDEAMEAIYGAAYRFYQGHSIEKAKKIFKFLCLYDHYNLKYFLGLAACHQCDKEYEDAIMIYSHAALLDTEDPRAPFHAGRCHLALGNLKQAASGFYAAKGWAQKDPRHADLGNRAAAMLELVQKRLDEQTTNTPNTTSTPNLRSAAQ